MSMGDQIVEPLTKFTYLGSDVDSNGLSTPEMHRRLGMASSIMGQLDTMITAETQPADKASSVLSPCPIRTLVRIRDLDTTQNRQHEGAGIPHDVSAQNPWNQVI